MENSLDSLINGLPQSMRYSLSGADAISSRTRLTRFDATSSTYTSNSNNKILIPVQADGFLDTGKSYLFLKVKTLHTGADKVAKLDGNVACLIDKLEISVSGSSGKVETIDRYNMFHLYDQTWNSGLEEITYQQAVNGGSAPALEWVADGASLAVAGEITLALKLKAGFLTSYFNKALPQGLPQFTIEITLASGVSAFNYTANAVNPEYEVSNVRWYAPNYQILNEQMMADYKQQIASETTMWVSRGVSSIINVVNNTVGKQTKQLNASYRSLNGMVSLMRPSADINSAVKNCLTSFNITNLTGYLYRIHGSQYPSDTIDVSATDLSRIYMEASKTLAPHGHNHSNSTAVSKTRFTGAGGGGSACISLTRFSDENLVNLGLDTSASSAPSIIELDFTTTAPASQDLTTYCLYDVVFMMNPDGTVERSF